MNTESPTGVAARQLVQRMGEAAENFLAALSTDQRAAAQLDFANQAERTTWHYTPTPRQGLPFTEMDRKQQRLAQALVMTGLSRGGYNTATTIMGLETLLDAKEGFTAQLWWRDSRLYHVTIFGSPDERNPWGWRFEGHHISLNYTIVGGLIVAPTPTFFGSNPAESPLSSHHSLRPLAGIEDFARDLLHSLSDEQRAHAILTSVAPPDIVMLNRPFVVEGALPAQTPGVDDTVAVASQFRTMARLLEERGVTAAELEAVRYSAAPKGIAASALTSSQQEILWALMGDYIHRMPDELAEIELKKLQQQGVGGIHFAWAGGLERRQPHYYRLQGPRFLVEYDNTQNDANHIHSVWRDPANDFGADILAQHYATSHHH
ncbi:MAG: DUF3500 domain-containing protein [Caldilineaceae bacterium]|nr:DUF3500 domain-containing protein [Caldilineaceae bacterium]